MTRRRLQFLIAAFALLGLGILLAIFHNFRSKWALQVYKEGLIAKGEKLTVEELTPSSSGEARDRANELVQAALQLKAGTVTPYHFSETMRFVLPGKAAISWKQSE